MAYFTQFGAATNWDGVAITAVYYVGLKDDVKDEIARGERLDDLLIMMVMAIRINNCLYKRCKKKVNPPMVTIRR